MNQLLKPSSDVLAQEPTKLFKADEFYCERAKSWLLSIQQRVNNGSSSRLLNLPEMLNAVFRTHVKDWKVDQPKGAVIEKYRLDFGNIKADINVVLFNHNFQHKRRIGVTDSAVKHNLMMHRLGVECMDAGVPAEEVVMAQDLFARCFTVASQGNQYSVEIDDGFWEVVYCDARGNTQVQVTVSLR